jgi:hypothetical protein
MESSRTENEDHQEQVKDLENNVNAEESKNNGDIRDLYNISYTRSGK